ncbi:MAG TPA: hypothetical protein PLW31_09860 [Bacteroidales bacterium]|nr:hypothetical protein [Bacteroidales bacterium]HPM93416.1 hypothetical protein [Bacteroidales bacterium]
MKPVDHHLRQLLYEYDCVTIPGLGGFIMQSVPSRLNQTRQRIFPPNRYPAFNSFLNHDDGLLISHIARHNNLSYSQASLFISEFVSECQIRFTLGQRVVLEGIGEMFHGDDGTVQFIQKDTLNFNPGSTGMDSLALIPVSGESKTIRKQPKPEDRKTPAARKEKQPASARWTVAVSLPIILFLIYGIIFPASVQNLYTEFAGILSGLREESFYKTSDKKPVSAPLTVNEPVRAKTSEPVPLPPETETEVKIDPVIQGAETGAIITGPRYYIIGGCFEHDKNAERFLVTLISKGFDAELAGKTNRGHTRVSYKSFEEKEPALSYLIFIRKEENASAWLLKY